jgi:hypothetical protein
MSNLELQKDLVVGRMIDGPLQTQVSLRGEVIVVAYSNTNTMRGFEVAYSIKAVHQLTELLFQAAKVARGVG